MKTYFPHILDYEDDNDLDDDPEVEHRAIPHPGGVNRLRVSSISFSSSSVKGKWNEFMNFAL